MISQLNREPPLSKRGKTCKAIRAGRIIITQSKTDVAMGYNRRQDKMKKFFNLTGIFALLATLTLSFNSCNNEQTVQDIVGTWHGVSEYGFINGETISQSIVDDEIYLIFSIYTFEIKRLGETIGKGTYNLDGKKLILSSSGKTEDIMTITELTQKKLVLRKDHNDMEYAVTIFEKVK